MPTENIFFDTHVHLDRLPADLDPALEVEGARRQGIEQFLIPGVEPRRWPRLLDLAAVLPGCLAAPGIHPQAAADWNPEVAAELAQHLKQPTVVAIGEIGLDGDLPFPTMETQERALRDQLRLARAAGLPVLLHCRKATGRLLEILRQENAGACGGIWHAFSGSAETARAAIQLNFVLAFGGSLTWPGARRAPQVLKGLPADSIVLESDAPYRAPLPHRGTPNRPAYMLHVAQRMGQLRGWDQNQTARITTANARRVLGLPSAA